MSYPFGVDDYDRRGEVFDGAPRPHPHLLRRVFLALLVMGLFAGGLWFAYREGARHTGGGNIPLIRADTRPYKVRPSQPGGLQIPDRGMLIYNPDRPMTDHLQPPPEQPLPRPQPPTPPASQAPSSLPTSGAAVPQLSPAPSAASAIGPAPAASGDIRLQLGALRSEDAARREWDRIKGRNPDLLGKMSATVIRVDLSDKGVFYRIQAGPVGTLSAAEAMCSKLRQRSLGCILVR